MRYCYPLLLGLLLGCQHPSPDVLPAPAALPDSYDVLARQVGHWRWERTIIPFEDTPDSAAVGYGR